MGKIKTIEERFWPKVKKTTTCWLWIGAKNKRTGYGILGSIYSKYYETAHRTSWALHKGKIPKGLCVCHKCDIRLCVRPSHLFLGTQQDNLTDMLKKRRHWHKLSIRNIKMIRKLHKRFTRRSIAHYFCISHTMVNDIINGKWWKNI